MSLKDNYTYEEPEERSNFVLLPKGEYPFEIEEVYDWQVTSNQNDMLPLKLSIDGGDLGQGTAYDNIVFTDSSKWKIDQFLKCLFGGSIRPGKKVDFNDTSWLRGRKGTVQIEPKPVKGKDYQRNEVKAYTYPKTTLDKASRTVTAPPEPDPVEEEEDDNIPF